MKSLILLSLIMFSTTCLAEEMVIDAGLGVLNSKGYSLSQNKFTKIGLENNLWYALKQRINTGLWLDSRSDEYKSSAFGGYQLGFEVRNDTLIASIWSGPTLISSPDQQLGGMIQFNETIFLGITDKMGETIGIAYNHLSSAGLEIPNQGRDYVGLEIKFGL